MSNEQTPDDERDERVASLLEVPPLDDETRQRLVDRALEADRVRAGRSRRVLVAAAAGFVALVLVGAGVFTLVNRDGGDGTTAARSGNTSAAAPAPEGGSAPGESSRSKAAAGVRDVGDVGDVSDTSDLRRNVKDTLDHPRPTQRTTDPPCLDRAVTGSPAPTAFGTGTYQGRPVLVLVLPSANDRDTAVVLDTRTCRAVSVVTLS